MNIQPYDTLTEAITALRQQGYTEDFNLKEDCLECELAAIHLFPHEFEIDQIFRFYGASDPDDESILYAISSDHYHMKGLLVNGYGVSSDALTQEMVEKFKLLNAGTKHASCLHLINQNLNPILPK